jgi:hypothetical protein
LRRTGRAAAWCGGGLIGSAVLGQLFDRLGWPACVDGIAASLALAGILAASLKMTERSAPASPREG